jgi:endonuclease/exonuclease/phosphatase (EEP) superfamily protein YafD
LITLWPSFFWLLGLIPLTALTWNRNAKKYCLALSGAILLFLSGTVEWRSLVRPPDRELIAEYEQLRLDGADSDCQPLRVVTWNTPVARDAFDALLKQVEPVAPDLCFFQETPDDPEGNSPVDRSTFFKDYSWVDAGDCALLSRYPVTLLPSRRIGPWSPPQIARVEMPRGKYLLVVNVRLMLPALVLNPFQMSNWASWADTHQARLDQFESLARLIEETAAAYPDDAVVLAGDFNTPGGMRSLTPLERIPLVDAWRRAGTGWGATMTANCPMSRIDQCWVSPQIQAVQARVILGTPSDHRGLLVEMILD